MKCICIEEGQVFRAESTGSPGTISLSQGSMSECE